MQCKKKFDLKLIGAFDLIDEDGVSVRPAGRKDCALLAMLAVTRNHRQTRTWLQEKLWGDRGPAQGAASLRQALSTLRGILNAQVEAIGADRTWIWLNPTAFEFDHQRNSGPGELLRGLDLREDGFNDWLRQARADLLLSQCKVGEIVETERVERKWYFEEPTCNEGGKPTDFARVISDCLFEAIQVIGLSGVMIGRDQTQTPKPKPTDLIVRSNFHRLGDDCICSISVTDGFGNLKWQVRREASLRAWISIRSVQIDIAQQFQDFSIREEASLQECVNWSAHVNGCQALMGLVVPGSMPIQEIVNYSEAAIAADERGLYHAFLGQAHLRQYGEREALGPMDIDEVMKSVRTSILLSPGNGLVQALAGHSYGFFARDMERNSDMTDEAVRQLPGSGMCRIFQAISLVYNERYREAVQTAALAVTLCRGTMAYPQARSAHLFACLMVGDTKGAIRSGEEAVDALNYRPTVTDLMTAYALEGRLDEGRRKLQILQSREPDLCLDMLRAPEYPFVNSAHRTRVVRAARQLGLS